MANLSNINNKFLVTTGGNVGIGSTSPTSPLVVVGTGVGGGGTIGIQGANAHVGFKNSSGTFRSWVGHFNAVGHGSDADLNVKTGYSSVGNIRFTADGDTTAAQMFLQGSTGNVGIGIDTPQTLLNVNSLSGTTYPTLGTASGVIALSINELHGMYLGVDGASGNGWIQSMREDTGATAYNLILQPSGGNVGIGTTSPSSYYSGADNLVIKQASGEAGISIVTATDTTGALYFADGTTGSEQYRGGIAYTHSTVLLSLVSGGASRMFINLSLIHI